MDNLLEKNIEKDYGYQEGATMVGAIVAIIIGVILVFAAAIPITNDVISSAGLTGTTATLAQIVVTLLAIVPIVLVAQLL